MTSPKPELCSPPPKDLSLETSTAAPQPLRPLAQPHWGALHTGVKHRLSMWHRLCLPTPHLLPCTQDSTEQLCSPKTSLVCLSDSCPSLLVTLNPWTLLNGSTISVLSEPHSAFSFRQAKASSYLLHQTSRLSLPLTIFFFFRVPTSPQSSQQPCPGPSAPSPPHSLSTPCSPCSPTDIVYLPSWLGH